MVYGMYADGNSPEIVETHLRKFQNFLVARSWNSSVTRKESIGNSNNLTRGLLSSFKSRKSPEMLFFWIFEVFALLASSTHSSENFTELFLALTVLPTFVAEANMSCHESVTADEWRIRKKGRERLGRLNGHSWELYSNANRIDTRYETMPVWMGSIGSKQQTQFQDGVTVTAGHMAIWRLDSFILRFASLARSKSNHLAKPRKWILRLTIFMLSEKIVFSHEWWH